MEDAEPEVTGQTGTTDGVRPGSFGAVAASYDRFRPGPPIASVEWLVPTRLHRVVDLGAGTGALTRLLVDRADEVIAVEPDDRMRAVLAEQVPDAIAVKGRTESMPLPDASADAALASSSWHWVDPVAGLTEVGRVLVPGGRLGVVWSGPDLEAGFMSQARAVLARRTADDAASDFGDLVFRDSLRPEFVLRIPEGLPFSEPEHEVVSWDMPLNADELIGLLGTLSWIITMPDDERRRVIETARGFLRDLLGVEGDVTVDVTFRADAWRCHHEGT
jgi:SAM-dependent methyltransferase